MMAINIRAKGAEGERQIIRMLTPIIQDVMRTMEFPEDKIKAAAKMVQRNQNQSAVGGNDLSNAFGLSIEIKRQEQLAINTWWTQCENAAMRNNELPVLIFKQNNKPWRFITWGFLHCPGDKGGWTSVRARVEFNEETFKTWFRAWVRGQLLNGWEARI